MYTQYYDNWCMPEYPSACSAGNEDEDEGLSYFQILGPDGTALEDPKEDCDSYYCNPIFTPNEFKDSQFWYLDIVPGTDFGAIGPKKYTPALRPESNNVLTLDQISCTDSSACS